MGKCEVMDGKQTNWCGLWYHPEYNGFSSEAINLATLKKFKGTVRLYVRKNKFFNGGENGRPNYNFCLKDADAKTFVGLEVVDDDTESENEDDENKNGESIENKIEELRDIMRAGKANADVMMLPSESQERARELMERAVKLVEEMTGEEWKFSYLTFD